MHVLVIAAECVAAVTAPLKDTFGIDIDADEGGVFDGNSDSLLAYVQIVMPDAMSLFHTFRTTTMPRLVMASHGELPDAAAQALALFERQWHLVARYAARFKQAMFSSQTAMYVPRAGLLNARVLPVLPNHGASPGPSYSRVRELHELVRDRGTTRMDWLFTSGAGQGADGYESKRDWLARLNSLVDTFEQLETNMKEDSVLVGWLVGMYNSTLV